MGKIAFEERFRYHELAWEVYAKAQANNEVPAWIVLNAVTTESRIASGIWTVTSCLYKHHILPPGMSWERRKDGLNELVSYSLETGERGMIASYDVADDERADFFEAEVDLSSRVATVTHSIPVSHLRPESFMLRYDNFDLTKTWRFDQTWEQNRLSVLSGRLV